MILHVSSREKGRDRSGFFFILFYCTDDGPDDGFFFKACVAFKRVIGNYRDCTSFCRNATRQYVLVVE